MESIYPKLALCGRNNECARTDTVFLPISEVSDGTVSLGSKFMAVYSGDLANGWILKGLRA